MGVLKQALREQRFVCLLEFVPKPSAQRFEAFGAIMRRERLGDWPLVPEFADRVGSPFDLSPLDAYATGVTELAPLLHFSGKDRERQQLLDQLVQMDAQGLDQMLLVSGDRLPGHEPGQRPVRYLESVPALQIVRQARPEWLLGAALNPFKYREEEGGAQYYKAGKKLAAGADYLSLQLGFDAQKHLEALAWMRRQPQPRPLLACVMGLTLARANMLEHVAGVVVTPSMRACLEADAAVSRAYAQQRSISRLALQIVGLQLMGYAGIHLSSVHDLATFVALEEALGGWREVIGTLPEWLDAWNECWRLPDGTEVTFHPPGHGWLLGDTGVQASSRERVRYHLLSAVHGQFFDREGWLGKAFGWAVRRPLWATAGGARWLHRLERGVKRPLVGCDTCGQCRLEDTLYVCPETCPKGLANGPCGGTRLNRCEFGDRECIHSVKYRTAVTVGQAAVLKERLIPCVQVEGRHRSSWPRWFEAPPLDTRYGAPVIPEP